MEKKMSEFKDFSKPVIYKGQKYDSTTEGRVAVLLDGLGANWEKEPIQLNGYMPDFVIKGIQLQKIYFEADGAPGTFYLNELYVEVKGAMRKNGEKTDAEKMDRFSYDHALLLINRFPLYQNMKTWESLVHGIYELSQVPLTGINPDYYRPWDMELISWDDTGNPLMLVATKYGGVDIINITNGYTDEDEMEWVDKEKTLKAYQEAQRYKFKSVVAKAEEEKAIVEEENGRLKEQIESLKKETPMPTIVLKRKETKNKRVQLLIKPSTLSAIDSVVEKVNIENPGSKFSRNELINQVLEQYCLASGV